VHFGTVVIASMTCGARHHAHRYADVCGKFGLIIVLTLISMSGLADNVSARITLFRLFAAF
jgi:hypothetical protein